MHKKVLQKHFRRYLASVTNNSVSTDSIINSKNINNIKELWKIETTSPVSSDPIIYFGNVYFTDWEGNAYCANKQNGKLIWKKKIYSPPTVDTCVINKIPLPKSIKEEIDKEASDVCPPYLWNGFAGTGVILGNIWYIASVGGKEGPPLFNYAPGKLYAIDITTHEVIWSVPVTEYKRGGALAKLLVYDGIVYVGICGIEEPADVLYKLFKLKIKPETVGSVVAFDCMTGEKIWERKTVGLLDDDNMNAKGAGVWCSFALCSKCNNIYFGTGNNYGPPASKSSDSIIALDCKTGEFRWQNQVIEGDVWLPGDEEHPDDDFGAGPQIFEIVDNDKNIIPVLGIGGKDGYYYVLDRRNGKIIWSTQIYTGKDSGSGIRGNAAVANGYVYVWSNNGWDEEIPKTSPTFSITVSCLDANTGKTIWSKVHHGAGAIGSGVLCNDVFLVGDMLGNIIGFKASDGEELWNINISDASISSSLVGNDNALYVGVGVPKAFGGLPKNGVYAFGLK